MSIDEILKQSPEQAVRSLQEKTVKVPAWEELRKAHDPDEHPVMTDPNYHDVTDADGNIRKVVRITLDFFSLAAVRSSELCFGIPVRRIYNAQTDGEKKVAKVLEAILKRNRIDSVNIERGEMLFAGCETATMWFAIEEPNTLYGIESRLKLRCRNYSPMNDDSIYPLFDPETDDMVALSFGYKRKDGDKEVEYLDTYTANKHIRYKKFDSWTEEFEQNISMGKIPAVYYHRPLPAWKKTENTVYEMEWKLSRNGNYLGKNLQPILALFADEEIAFNQEKGENQEFRVVGQYPKGSDLRYVTWPQAVDNLKYHVDELRQLFFTQLQLPDWSHENMKSTPMSGEARRLMFTDAHLKVKDESGRLIEMLDREINVIKSFMKIMMPANVKDIDSLQIENVISPFSINDDRETVGTIMMATGGKAVMSRREGIENFGWSMDVDRTLQEILDEEKGDAMNLTI